MKNVMNEEEILKSIEKIRMYQKEESLLFSEIKVCLLSLEERYKSENQKQLSLLYEDVFKQCKTITDNHCTEIDVLTKHLQQYQTQRREVEKSFQKIGEEAKKNG